MMPQDDIPKNVDTTNAVSHNNDTRTTTTTTTTILMDETEKQALQKANEFQEHGESIVATMKDLKNYQPFIESLTKSLLKRESILGRYNHITAQSYSALGDIYLQMNEPRAVVMYRTCFRIHTFLYGKCNGHISGTFRDVLTNRQHGLSQHEMEDVRNDILQSMRFEMEGDLLRRFGNRKEAVREYQKAARVEEFAFGRDNPDLAYICRKMACLASINFKTIDKGVNKNLHPPNHFVRDFEEADRIGHKWMKNCKDFLSPNICAYIRKGDKYYESLLYGHAVSEYIRATMVENNLGSSGGGGGDRKSKSGKNKHKGSNHSKKAVAKTEKQTEDMAEELRLFLAGKLPAPTKAPPTAAATNEHQYHNQMMASSSHHRESDGRGVDYKYQGSSTTNMSMELGPFGTRPPRPQNWNDDDAPKRSPRLPRPSMTLNENNFTRTTTAKDSSTRRYDDMSPATMRSTKVSEAIQKFEQGKQRRGEQQTVMEVSTRSVVPPAPTSTSSMPLPPAPPPKASPVPSLKSTRSSRSSSSNKKRRSGKNTSKARESLSESSLLTLMKPPSYLDPKKPKSDSYITKIAQKTTKIAKNHLRSQLQRSRSGSSKDKSKSVRGGGGGASSFFASLRKERSSNNHKDDDAPSGCDDNDTVSMLPPAAATTTAEQSHHTNSTYHFLGSPPMTPYHPKTPHQEDDGSTGDKDLGNFLRESIETHNFHRKAPLDSPSRRGRRKSAGDNEPSSVEHEQDESIDHSNVFGDQHQHQEQQRHDDHYVDVDQYNDDDDDEESTEPLKIPDESSCALESFFDDEELEKPSAKVFSAMDTQSVMTSDESIKERFLDETEKMTNAILNHANNDNSNNSEDGGEEQPPQPTLVEMVAHVQKLSALLQRQTFRLQHKLGDVPASHTEGDIKRLPVDQLLPQGTVELCKEVERLFESCDETLELAFSRLDEKKNKTNKHKKGRRGGDDSAMEEYRKTFALEQVFLNDLRKGVTDVLAQYSMSATQSADGGDYFVQQGNSLSSSGDMLFDLPGFPTTTSGDMDDSAGSMYLEESMLSVVFEDNSKSTSPSEQPQKLRLL